jgi:hypothetical protein
MNLENPLLLIHQLKGGAKLAIFIIMAFEKKPVNQEYLSRWSGYSMHSVQESLDFMADPTVNLVTKLSRYSWQLTSYAQQLPLMAELTDGLDGTRNLCESFSTTATATIEGTANEVGSSSSKRPGTRNLCESVQILHAAGIGHPTCDQLAKLSWATVDYLRAHIKYAQKNGISTAQLIHKIRQNDDAPEIQDPNDYRKYITGEWAHLIEH